MGVLAVAGITVLLWLRKHKRRCQQWISVHTINSRRPEFETFGHLFLDLVNNPEKLYDFFRITKEQFKMVVELTASSIRKQNANYRLAVRPEGRLAIVTFHKETIHPTVAK